MDTHTIPGPRNGTPEARSAVRDRVIRRVQLVADGRTYDAIMLDVSENGARVQVASAEPMPYAFHLRSSDGTVQRVARRWVQGAQMGVEFLRVVETPEQSQPSRPEPGDVQTAIRQAPVRDALSLLVRASHYGDDTLRTAARDLVAALDRVERALSNIETGGRTPQ